MIEEKIPESCVDCPKFIYKGDDEQFCRAARFREVWLKRWQKKPKWCPLEKMKRNYGGNQHESNP